MVFPHQYGGGGGVGGGGGPRLHFVPANFPHQMPLHPYLVSWLFPFHVYILQLVRSVSSLFICSCACLFIVLFAEQGNHFSHGMPLYAVSNLLAFPLVRIYVCWPGQNLVCIYNFPFQILLHLRNYNQLSYSTQQWCGYESYTLQFICSFASICLCLLLLHIYLFIVLQDWLVFFTAGPSHVPPPSSRVWSAHSKSGGRCNKRDRPLRGQPQRDPHAPLLQPLRQHDLDPDGTLPTVHAHSLLPSSPACLWAIPSAGLWAAHQGEQTQWILLGGLTCFCLLYIFAFPFLASVASCSSGWDKPGCSGLSTEQAE